jgi:hypothetical protein
MQPPIAIGCMRLSTAADRDEARGIEVLHAALDAGVTLFDTANAYCLDATETGHNERLIARALSTWRGDRSGVRIATKGGLTRPEGRWEADGRARALTVACESSLIALGVARIDLYQLHVPDPRVPLATSVRALHALRRRGLGDRHRDRILPARRRSARVLVPQTAPGPGSGAPGTAPARPGAMRLRRQRPAGPRFRAPAGVRVSPRGGVFLGPSRLIVRL